MRTCDRLSNYICRLGCLAPLALVLFAALADTPATAQQPASTVILFDGSGSMWGKLPGSSSSKFKMAAQMLRENLRDIQLKPKISVAVFGQQSRGGCTASRIIAPLTAYNDDGLATAIGKLNPQGRGPLVLGLKTAANALAQVRGPRSIIIVHDDPDNCDQDLCAAAQSLKQTAPDIRVFAVTLGPKDQNRGALACLAKSTGGQVFEVDNADMASTAISSAVRAASLVLPGKSAPRPRKTATASPTAPAARPTRPAKPKRAIPPSPGLMLSAVLKKGGATLQTGLIWRISRLQNGTVKLVHHTILARPSLSLKPGRYQVDFIATGTEKRFEIDVGKGPRTRHEVVLDQAAINLSAVLTKGGAAVTDANFEVAKIGGADDDPIWTGLPPQAPLLLPAGNYKLTTTAGRAKQVRSFKAIAGAVTTITLPLQAGYLHVKSDAGSNNPSVPTVVTVETDDPGRTSGRRLIARSAQPSPNFLLSAGTYYVTVDNGYQRTQELVAIAPGKVVESSFSIPVMRLGLIAKLRGAEGIIDHDVRYRIWSVKAKSTPPLTSEAARPEFELSPGQYRVEARIGAQNAVVVRDFDIGNAPSGQIELEFDAGTVAMKMNTPSADVFWQIRDSSGDTVWRTMEPAPRMTLKSGRYTLIADLGTEQTQGEIVVESGRHIDIELGRN